MKKLIAILLSAALLLSVCLTGCGEAPAQSSESNTGTPNEASANTELVLPEEETEEPMYDPGIESIDYKGRDFVIMDRTPDSSGWWISMDVYAEELTGEPVTDAVFNRNETVNRYFNIRILPHRIPDGNFLQTLRNSAAANDHVVDLAMLTLGTSISSAKSGLLFDLFLF